MLQCWGSICLLGKRVCVVKIDFNTAVNDERSCSPCKTLSQELEKKNGRKASASELSDSRTSLAYSLFL